MKRTIWIAMPLCLAVLFGVAVYEPNHRVSASEKMPNLQGQPAVDYLKRHGLFEKVRAAVEADRRRIRGAANAGAGFSMMMNSVITEVKKIVGSDVESEDEFGYSVGISGDTMVVGAPDQGSKTGAAYVFERNKGGADTWNQVAKLVASDGAENDEFGRSVGISGDTVVVGAPGDHPETGAAYIFERNKGAMGPEADNWGEVKKLTASDGEVGNLFGYSVAISGNTVAVAAPFGAPPFGAAYIFERNKGAMGPAADNWGEVKRLIPSDMEVVSAFGFSVAISVDTVVVGAWGGEAEKGAAHIYERNKGGVDNWGGVKKLIASDGVVEGKFGYSVGISGDTIVVGAPGEEPETVAAYIFERNKGAMGPVADNWGEVKKLVPPDVESSDKFGYSVGISGDTVVVGDWVKGAAHVYERNKGGMDPVAENWGAVEKLTPSNTLLGAGFGWAVGISGNTVAVATPFDFNKGAAYAFAIDCDLVEKQKRTASDRASNDEFGWSVSISGDTVVVGAPGDDTGRGAAYILERNRGAMGPEADNWGEVKKLTASDREENDAFGWSVAISGDTVVVGAWGDESQRGAAYIFERNKGAMGPAADNWGEVKKLTASDGGGSDFFGFSVAISGDTVVIGAYQDDTSRGSAYIFERNKGAMGPAAENWGEVKKLVASDGEAEDRFGFSVGISGDTVVVGATYDDSIRGAAYIFERNKGVMGPAAENWGEVKKLVASDRAADDAFGGSVAISGDTVVIGAGNDDTGRGSVYIFERNKGEMGPEADNWGEVKQLFASDGEVFDQFGISVGISGDTVVVGSNHDDTYRGAVYIFERNKGVMGSVAENWGEVKKLTASDREVSDEFGFSVGISGDTVVVGAWDDDDREGSSYIFACEGNTNTAPTIAPINATRTAGSGGSISGLAAVGDAEDDENTLSVAATALTGTGVMISGISVDAAGNVTASIEAGCAATTSTFELKVTDSEGGMATATLTVTVNPNPLPVLSYTNKSLGLGKTALFYPSTGPSDNVGVASIVMQTIAPATGLALSVNASSGVVTVVSASVAGTYMVEVVASDNCGAQRVASFNVTVTCPTVTLGALANGQAGIVYNKTIAMTPGGSYSFSLTNGALPPGLTLDAMTGQVMGTPTATGTFNFRVTALGASGCSGSRNYSLVISCPAVAIAPTTLPAATLGMSYNQMLTVTPTGSYAFAVNFGSLPPGMTLNAMTGVLSGVPTLKGNYYITIRAGGFGTCSGTRTYVLVVQ